jgi:hypothetical protein
MMFIKFMKGESLTSWRRMKINQEVPSEFENELIEF